jgi:dephospho-CoA kinase
VRRLVEIRGIPQRDAVARVNAQASDDERLSIADVVIDATGSMQHTIDQADALWERLVDSAETE